MSRRGLVRQGALAKVIVVVLVLSACTVPGVVGPSSTPEPRTGPTPGPTTQSTDCADPGSPVDLGAPAPDAEPTLFTVTAGRFRFEATRFPHGQPLDPQIGRTALLLGLAADPPRYDAGRGSVANATHELNLVESVPAVLDLTAGQYWMVNSNGVWITITGCSAAVTDVAIS